MAPPARKRPGGDFFFVALTRARTEVVVSVAQHNARGRPQQRAIFLDEIAAATDYRLETASLGAEAAADMAALRLQPSDPGQLPGWERAAITELLKGYRLSVSGLYSYLNCPTAFFYEKLLRVPDLEREENLYGSALHDTLEAYFLRMKQDTARIFPSKEELRYYFTQMLGRRRGLFSPESFNQRLEQGQRELTRYHDQHRHHWVTDVETELMIRNVEVDGIPLTGVIDRVDILSDAAVRVVDYKTSGSGKRVLSSKIKGPTPTKPAGGNYWRQLNFYKLLYDYQPGNIRRVKEGVISFLLLNTEGEQPEASVSLQPKDQAALRAILREAWEGIQAQQFTGCGEADCAWCQFVADFRQTAPLEKPDNELDDPS